jgi:hypothetical protein
VIILTILILALVFAIVSLIESKGCGLLNWAVLLTDVYLMAKHL